MKNSIIAVLLAVCFATVSVNAEAQSRANKRAAAEHPVETTMAAPERGSSGSSTMSFGLGVSTIAPISFVAPGVTGSVTGIINLTNLDLVQLFVSIPDTVGSFKFGVAGAYKRTLFGNAATGFHLGGGLGLGTNGDFAMNILGVVGVHYTLSGTNVAFHFDGGPVFSLQKVTTTVGTTSTSNTQTSFGIGQYSNVLGASVAYMF